MLEHFLSSNLSTFSSIELIAKQSLWNWSDLGNVLVWVHSKREPEIRSRVQVVYLGHDSRSKGMEKEKANKRCVIEKANKQLVNTVSNGAPILWRPTEEWHCIEPKTLLRRKTGWSIYLPIPPPTSNGFSGEPPFQLLGCSQALEKAQRQKSWEAFCGGKLSENRDLSIQPELKPEVGSRRHGVEYASVCSTPSKSLVNGQTEEWVRKKPGECCEWMGRLCPATMLWWTWRERIPGCV